MSGAHLGGTDINTSRRRFLVGSAALGGALLVGCAPAPAARLGTGDEIPEPRGETALNAWLRIGEDNTVTVAVARAEMGQGVTTTLPMLVAEELGCDWQQVRYELVVPEPVHGNVTALVDMLPFRDDDHGSFAGMVRSLALRLAGSGQLVTGGGSSLRDAWAPLRIAGAAARYALIRAAARSWEISANELTTEAGHVLHPDGRKLSFGELAEAAAHVPLPSNFRLKAPADFRLLGRAVPRLDLAGKIDGSARFGADIRLPNMLWAAVRMCPVAGGAIRSMDDTVVRHQNGVKAVLRVDSVMGSAPSVVVVANDYWSASKAAAALPIVWDEGARAHYDSDKELGELIAAVHEQTGSSWRSEGDMAAAELSGARRIDALYTVPMLAAAALETACCTALFETERRVARLKIWAPTQYPGLYAQAAARAADLTRDRVDIQPTLIGGAHGYKGLLEPLVQAVVAAKALPNRPVQVIWSRAQDMAHDLYRPATVGRASAWLTGEGKSGRWAALRLRSAGPSVLGALLARTLPPWLARRVPDKTMIEGGYDNPYTLDAQEVFHIRTETAAPIGFWRSVGHCQQAFFLESFVDEVAYELRQDPLEVRLRKLRNAPREAEVLQIAAREAQWTQRQPRGSALGLAVHSTFGSVCAQVVHLVRQDNGRIRIENVVCVADCGFVVHPDIVAQQLEGSVLFGLSTALHGKISVKAGRVVQRDFAAYPILGMAQSPTVRTLIVPSRASEPGGASEVALPPAAPALCNAIFRLTGVRVRDLPVADQIPFV